MQARKKGSTDQAMPGVGSDGVHFLCAPGVQLLGRSWQRGDDSMLLWWIGFSAVDVMVHVVAGEGVSTRGQSLRCKGCESVCRSHVVGTDRIHAT